MNHITKTTLVTVACMAFIGCGDSYSDNKKAAKAELKVLDRNARFLTDTQGLSLYTFDKDALNKSNCDAECQKIWPLFTGVGVDGSDLTTPENDQLAYKKHPLYYFKKDKIEGDVLGNNIKNVWHLVHTKTVPMSTQVALSSTIIKQSFLTDKDGRALYTFDKDEKDVSNCYDATPTEGTGCESTWPVFYSEDLGNLPSGTSSDDFGVIQRDVTRAKKGESLKQVSFKGQPLYYFTPDNKEAGSIKGDWVKGVWHLVETAASKVDMSTGTTSDNSVQAGKTRFVGCATCHGEDGLNKAFGISIKIGELDASSAESKLNYMKNDGTGKNSTMVGIAKNLSEDEIKNLSAYIGTL